MFCLKSIQGFAQFDLSRYFDASSFNLVDLSDHLDVEFKWVLKGKSQAFINEGINEYLEGNIPQAIANLDEVLKSDSTFWPAFYYMGLCNKNTRKLKEAEVDFKKKNHALAALDMQRGSNLHRRPIF